MFGFGLKPTEGLTSVYECGVRIETVRICIHSQLCKAVKIPKRVWNSPAQLIIVKPPVNTMRGMVRRGMWDVHEILGIGVRGKGEG